MSFILDALKKSETDRQRQSTPALFEVKVAAPRRRLPVWGIALGALLGVNVLVLLWVLLREPRPTAAMPEPATAAATTPANVMPGNAPAAAPSPAAAPPASTGVVAPSVAPPLAEEPMLSASEPSVPPDYDASDYAPAMTPGEANAAAVRRQGSLPSRDEVIAQGTQLPDQRLDFHLFSPNPAERFVFLNMRKLREGESTVDGVHVEAITQRGAQLSYRGTRFSMDGN